MCVFLIGCCSDANKSNANHLLDANRKHKSLFYKLPWEKHVAVAVQAVEAVALAQ